MNNRLKNKFVRNVAIVASGTAGAQAITMGFAPIITRIYGPESFGLLGVFTAILTVLAPVAALTYPTAIVLPREDMDAKGLAKISLILAALISVIIALILYFLGDYLLRLFGAETVTSYIALIPLAMFFTASLQIHQQWLIRKKLFKITARVAVAQALIVNCAKTGLGWISPTAVVLIIIASIGPAIHSLMLSLSINKNKEAHVQRQGNKVGTSLYLLAKRHNDFAFYRAPQVFINAISQSLPVLMLSSFFGPISAGFYALGKMVLGVPSTLISKSVGDVFYPRIAEAAHDGKALTRLIVKATLALTILGAIPFGSIVIFGPWLFELVFGSEWVVAGEYARWLALFFFFNFLNKPCVASVPVLGIQKGLLIYELLSTAGKVAGLFVGFYIYNNDFVAIALFSVIGIAGYSLMILWIIARARIRDNDAKTSQ